MEMVIRGNRDGEVFLIRSVAEIDIRLDVVDRLAREISDEARDQILGQQGIRNGGKATQTE